MTTTNITVDQLPRALERVLRKYDKLSLKSADKILSKVTLDIFGGVIEDTPVGDFDPDHEGTLKGSWMVTKRTPSSSRVNRQMPRRKGDSIKKQISNKMATRNIPMFLTSNSPYVNVVEWGGYIKNPTLGTYNKVTRRHEIRSIGGFSKQAPRGMVRRNAKRFNRLIKRAAQSL